MEIILFFMYQVKIKGIIVIRTESRKFPQLL